MFSPNQIKIMKEFKIDLQENTAKKDQLLLLLLPFWTPLIPPLGISCLKGFLKKHGYRVKTVDANPELIFREFYIRYLDTLKKVVPENKRGNFYNTGNDVLRQHLMACFNSPDDGNVEGLLTTLISRYYFVEILDVQKRELNNIVRTFYVKLEHFLLELVRRESPTVFGLSVFSGNFAPSLFAFKLIKSQFPSIKTVMGGGIFSDILSPGTPNFKRFMEQNPFIDCMIIGEGELLFLKYLEKGLPPGKRAYSQADINGEIMDIASAESPDFSDFNLQQYYHLTGYASRSCLYQCNFCSETVQWGKYRKKDGKKIVDELIETYKKYGAQLFLFGDSLLNPVISDLANEFKGRSISLYWDGYLRADPHVCDSANTELWRKGGFYRARLGVESGSQRILNTMNKKITTDQIKKAISSLAEAGIKTTTYWVIGYPGETESDFQETLNLVSELKDNIWEAECNPFNFYLSGQVNSEKWANENGIKPLFQDKTLDLLLTQTYMVNSNPSREETYDRICRFAAHCIKQGIPNPYSLQDIIAADHRWKTLHEKSVPSILDLKEKYVTER